MTLQQPQPISTGPTRVTDDIRTCPINNCNDTTDSVVVTFGGTRAPIGIDIVGSNLYWVDGLAELVQTCPIAACSGNVVDLVDSGLNFPYGLTATDTNLYWTDLLDSLIQTCPIDDCNNSTVTTLVDDNVLFVPRHITVGP